MYKFPEYACSSSKHCRILYSFEFVSLDKKYMRWELNVYSYVYWYILFLLGQFYAYPPSQWEYIN